MIDDVVNQVNVYCSVVKIPQELNSSLTIPEKSEFNAIHDSIRSVPCQHEMHKKKNPNKKKDADI